MHDEQRNPIHDAVVKEVVKLIGLIFDEAGMQVVRDGQRANELHHILQQIRNQRAIDAGNDQTDCQP